MTLTRMEGTHSTQTMRLNPQVTMTYSFLLLETFLEWVSLRRTSSVLSSWSTCLRIKSLRSVICISPDPYHCLSLFTFTQLLTEPMCCNDQVVLLLQPYFDKIADIPRAFSRVTREKRVQKLGWLTHIFHTHTTGYTTLWLKTVLYTRASCDVSCFLF